MVFELNSINDTITAKKFFKNYVLSNYDLSVKEINLKFHHTYRVAKLAKEISIKEGWSNEDMNLAYIISLFHDIGRFEQWTKYQTFWDNRSIDHAQLGIDILEDKGILKKISKQYKDIIYEGIFQHNKYKIPYNLDILTDKFVKISRDADKIDIMNVKLHYYKKEIKENYISESCYDSFLKKECINYNDIKTDLDLFLLTISWWYELYYKSSRWILLNKNYLNTLLDIFPEDDKKENIVNIVNSFVV